MGVITDRYTIRTMAHTLEHIKNARKAKTLEEAKMHLALAESMLMEAVGEELKRKRKNDGLDTHNNTNDNNLVDDKK